MSAVGRAMRAHLSIAGLLSAPAAPVPRVTPNSRAGRRLAQAKGAQLSDDSRIPPDVRAWNAEIERQRALRKAKKK